MKQSSKISHKFLISGGGTGGHIFPALAIADELKLRYPDAEFLFIGAKDKMEMEKIPKHGYPITGIWISGFNRSNLLKNLSMPLKIMSSLWTCYRVISNMKPTLAVGTGGFASGPALWMASVLGVKIFLQEQNSFPGITNKFLASKAEKIFVAYDTMDRFFPSKKLVVSGNPIRHSILEKRNKQEALKQWGLDPAKLTILSVGGSLGSRTLNTCWLQNLQQLLEKEIQLIWQTGSLGYEDIKNNPSTQTNGIVVTDFIKDMTAAYAAADIIVSRSGAIAISELCVIGKPTLFVPFPFASEDHQTKNAAYLVDKKAAKMLPDTEVADTIMETLATWIDSEEERKMYGQNLQALAKPEAVQTIVDELEKYI